MMILLFGLLIRVSSVVVRVLVVLVVMIILVFGFMLSL